MNETLNFNYAQCIKEAHNFGSDVYTNICNGATSVVNWGSVDWFWNITGLVFFASAVLAVTVAFAGMFYGLYLSIKEA